MTHRPSALSAMDHILMLKDGKQMAFGPRDQVLKEMSKALAQSQQAQSKQVPSQTAENKAAPVEAQSQQKKTSTNKRVDMPAFGNVTPLKGGNP